ncbi:MAG TPA: 50S ribosomal protein L7ae [Clostridiales bacterium]|nr:50S ribosomal protein L7ae [Clostridiales bacterium]
MEANEKFARMMGMARRAGKAVLGAGACDAAIKSGAAKLVVVDGGASERTKNDFKNACGHYEVKIIVLHEANILERCLGKPGNKLMGITDAGFAEKVIDLYGDASGGE